MDAANKTATETFTPGTPVEIFRSVDLADGTVGKAWVAGYVVGFYGSNGKTVSVVKRGGPTDGATFTCEIEIVRHFVVKPVAAAPAVARAPVAVDATPARGWILEVDHECAGTYRETFTGPKAKAELDESKAHHDIMGRMYRSWPLR